jgi:hypothetical protein
MIWFSRLTEKAAAKNDVRYWHFPDVAVVDPVGPLSATSGHSNNPFVRSQGP